MDPDIKACFPHREFRPHQYEFIAEAISAFKGGKKNVIVEAPTGAGKTPAIICIANYFTRGFDGKVPAAKMDADRAYAIGRAHGKAAEMEILTELGEHQAHMITSLKMLQDQYLRDGPLVKIMKGKGNYICTSPVVAPGTTCSDREMVFGAPCDNEGKRRACSYIAARRSAQWSRLSLHNFDSFLNQASLGGSFPPRKILTIDEAHGADDRLISSLSFVLDQSTFTTFKLNWTPAPPDDKPALAQWLVQEDKNLSDRIIEETNALAELNGKASFRNSKDFAEVKAASRRVSFITDLKRRIGRFLASPDKPWAVEVGSDPKLGATMKFEPVRSAPFANSALLRFGEMRLFMSATIFDNGRRLMSSLNLKSEETHYIAVPCVFPKANRPLVDLSVADAGQTEYVNSKPLMMASIKALMDRHQGVRGVIHCNSYQVSKDIREHVRDARLLFHESSTREHTVNWFMNNSGVDSVLVGVFLKEGYDFRDDMCRFQIIPRIPYPYPDQRTKMRDESEPGYYDWLTAIDLVQTYGRGTRSDKDQCVTYVLDSRLRKFMRRAGYMMPSWFKEAIVTPAAVGIITSTGKKVQENDDDHDVHGGG